MKRRPSEYQYQRRTSSGTVTKRVSEMTLDELQQALCRAFDVIERLNSDMREGQDAINQFLEGTDE